MKGHRIPGVKARKPRPKTKQGRKAKGSRAGLGLAHSLLDLSSHPTAHSGTDAARRATYNKIQGAALNALGSAPELLRSIGRLFA